MIFLVQDRVEEDFTAGTKYDRRAICVSLVDNWCLHSGEIDKIFSLAVGQAINITKVLLIWRIA